MKTTTIPLVLPSDLLMTLNVSEEELRERGQIALAAELFKEAKLTLGQAVRLSGLGRMAFEKELAKRKIAVINLSEEQILADIEKLRKN